LLLKHRAEVCDVTLAEVGVGEVHDALAESLHDGVVRALIGRCLDCLDFWLRSGSSFFSSDSVFTSRSLLSGGASLGGGLGGGLYILRIDSNSLRS
jgi:hypothetical protein